MRKRLCHEHVLQFHGVDKTNYQPLALVYDWEDSGNIVLYPDSNSKVSRTRLVSSPSPIVDPKLYSSSTR